MKIQEMVQLLNADLLTEGADLEKEVNSACGSDMMSDVLAYVKDQAVLVTGLTNPQVIRTASMMDMVCVVFARGKRPDGMVLALAKEMDIIVLATKRTMFTTCGLLYSNGLRGGTPPPAPQ